MEIRTSSKGRNIKILKSRLFMLGNAVLLYTHLYYAIIIIQEEVATFIRRFCRA